MEKGYQKVPRELNQNRLRKGFDLNGIISWWDNAVDSAGKSVERHFTQDMAPPRPLLKAGASTENFATPAGP